MSDKQKPFYITTTLPYANSELHMGHALEFIRADAVARYQKLQGREVFFNTGSDEHGMKILETAKKQDREVQEYVDFYSQKFQETIKKLGITDEINFVCTSDEKHIKCAQEFWRRVQNNGFIYKKSYSAKYCIGCEEEKTDSELVDGKCSMHPNQELELIEEENYFFKYSEFGEELLKLYETKPNFVIPEVRLNEVREFVKRGLRDFSISRLKTKNPWGIPVPDDDDQTMYVWFDALTSYISTLGWPDKAGNFEQFWLNGEVVQWCGKDNNRFQSAMWQAMLMAANLPNSDHIIINGFITAEGGVKMSKSLGNGINPLEIVSEHSTDALRYFLLKEISSSEDSPFSRERFLASYNAGLANGLGNLVSRVMKMATANSVSLDIGQHISHGEWDAIETNYHQAFASYDLRQATNAVWELIAWADKFVQDNKPYSTIKTDRAQGEAQLQTLLHCLTLIAKLLQPLLPETAERIKTLIEINQMPENPIFLRI